jgi:hypothetical protein
VNHSLNHLNDQYKLKITMLKNIREQLDHLLLAD